MSNEGLRNLNENELEEVRGGDNVDPSMKGKAVDLIGVYYETSFAEGKACDVAIGWVNLKLGRVFTDGRKAPYEIKRDGVTIGWAPESSITIIG